VEAPSSGHRLHAQALQGLMVELAPVGITPALHNTIRPDMALLSNGVVSSVAHPGAIAFDRINMMFVTYDEIFDERGESYHRAMELCPDARRREFRLAVDSLALKNGAVLCDIPAGGGYLIDYLPPTLDIWLIAIDPSEVFARQWHGVRIESHLASLQDLPIADAACDAVVSIAGLHHIDDRPSVLREIRRILRPDGRLCILEVAAGSPVDAFLNGFVDAHSSMGHRGRFVDDSFRADLQTAGFRIECDELCRYTWDFSSEDDMAEFVRLLFGLDKAGRDDVLAGISRLLGYECGGDGCRMNWALQALIAT